MAWQIQCKQHFLKQLDTLNNQIESKKTLNWHEDVQMYYWDCMRERGSERSNVLLLNMYESLWKLYEVMWDLLREVLWYESCVRVVWGVRWSKYSLNPDRPRLDKTRWDMTKTYGKTDLTRLDGLTDHI